MPTIEDDEMVPNEATWECDTPTMLTVLLTHDARTRMKTGTSVHYSISGSLPPGVFGVWFCPKPQRHAHVSMGAANPLSSTAICAVVSYALALALDREDWSKPVPDVNTIKQVWKDVISVVHEHASEYLADYLEATFDDANIESWAVTHYDHEGQRGPHSGREGMN